MFNKIEQDLKNVICQLYNISVDKLDKLVIERPPEKILNQYDLSTNIALILSKDLHTNPMEIASDIAEKLKKISYIQQADIVKPAFINIKLNDDALLSMIEDICTNGDKNLIKNLG